MLARRPVRCGEPNRYKALLSSTETSREGPKNRKSRHIRLGFLHRLGQPEGSVWAVSWGPLAEGENLKIESGSRWVKGVLGYSRPFGRTTLALWRASAKLCPILCPPPFKPGSSW